MSGFVNPRFHTTTIGASKTCAELVEVLRKHGAISATVMYADQEPTGVAFQVPVPGLDTPVPISMSVQTDEILRRLPEGKHKGEAQARRVAWRQLKMLVELQLEIVANGIKEFHEVFAGDVITEDGRTVGQRMAELMAPEGRLRMLTTSEAR